MRKSEKGGLWPKVRNLKIREPELLNQKGEEGYLH